MSTAKDPTCGVSTGREEADTWSRRGTGRVRGGGDSSISDNKSATLAVWDYSIRHDRNHDTIASCPSFTTAGKSSGNLIPALTLVSTNERTMCPRIVVVRVDSWVTSHPGLDQCRPIAYDK